MDDDNEISVRKIGISSFGKSLFRKKKLNLSEGKLSRILGLSDIVSIGINKTTTTSNGFYFNKMSLLLKVLRVLLVEVSTLSRR